jgi:hypothetical protein
VDQDIVDADQRVSGREAVLRALRGLGFMAAIIAVLGLFWRGALDYASLGIPLGVVQSMHEESDRHSTAAAVVGGLVTFGVAVGAAKLLDVEAGFARDVACAALGAVVGAPVYALVTRLRSPARGA